MEYSLDILLLLIAVVGCPPTVGCLLDVLLVLPLAWCARVSTALDMQLYLELPWHVALEVEAVAVAA